MKALSENKQSQYHELPLVASTSLDWVLGEGVATTTLQKRRMAIRSELGLGDEDLQWMRKQSMGGLGSFQLVPSSVLLCLQTDQRWHNRVFLNTLSQSLTAHGLPKLMRSATFLALTEMMIKAVKALVKGGEQPKNIGRSVNHVIRELSLRTPMLRAAAVDYSNIMIKVASVVPQLDRYTGHVVRLEGPDALILVDRPEGKDLRWIATELLETFGLDEADAPFVMLEQHWSPDVRTSYLQPAIVDSDYSDEELADVEQQVRAQEKPMRDAVVPVY